MIRPKQSSTGLTSILILLHPTPLEISAGTLDLNMSIIIIIISAIYKGDKSNLTIALVFLQKSAGNTRKASLTKSCQNEMYSTGFHGPSSILSSTGRREDVWLLRLY